MSATPEEVAASLPPLTPDQVARIATLLRSKQPTPPAPKPRRPTPSEIGEQLQRSLRELEAVVGGERSADDTEEASDRG